MATEDFICEICDKEELDLADCRKCKSKVCQNCMIGTKCVDCVKDEEEESGGRPTRFNHKDY
jgi:hypothetical protein